MGIKRIVDVTFWTDTKVITDFTPEDRYFMLYLLTNPQTTQLGIYELTPKVAAFEMGYSVDSVQSLIERFTTHHELIFYSKETSEVAIKNYLWHSIIKGGKPVEDLLIKEIGKVKNKSLIQKVFRNIEDYDNLNATVKKILTIYINDNDNDNDNDVSYHDSYHDSSKPTKSKPSTIFDEVPENLLEPIKEFAKFRRESKKPMTKRAVTLLLGKLHEMTGGNVTECEKILNQSIMNGWTSVYPLKNDGNPFKEALRKELEYEQSGSNCGDGGYKEGISKLIQGPGGNR